ncbi:MAG: protein BatD [Verrucomicrobia bacterium]|nr:protein BatD [Verrucomicrobiota bacterium]MCH8514319.1 BatD family protein [Kiritimatiellia bacterium]
MKKTFFPILLIACLALTARAQVSLSLSPREISMDDTAQLTLEIQGNVSGGTPRLDLPEGLRVRGTSRQFSMVNNAQTTSFVYELQPIRTGTFTIGPYDMTVNNKTTEVGPVTLKVKEARVVRATEDLIIHLEASHERALVHQPVQLTVTLYSVHQLDDIQLAQFDTSGFEVGDWQSYQQRDRVIDGTRYITRRFTTHAVPVTPGTRSLAPQFMVQVLEPDEEITRGTRGMFTRRMTRRSVRIAPDPVEIVVESPPREGRPDDFTGAVGRFVFEGSASPRQLRVGEPITLRTQVNGTGNLRNLLPPSMQESDDFQVFTPRLVEEDLARDGLRGRKTIEQVIVPRHPEVSQVPKLRFSFFNPDDWKYETLEIGPFDLEVEPAPVRDTGPMLGGTGSLRLGTGPTILGQDLVYLKPAPGRLRPLSGGSVLAFTTLSGLPLMLWALAGIWVRRQQQFLDDPALARQKQAPRKLRQQLDDLKTHTRDGAALHEAIWQCLAEYLGDRFRIPPGEVDAAKISTHLDQRLAPETLQNLQDWLKRCERARFAGEGNAEAHGETAESFTQFMLKLDAEVRS